MPQQIVTTDITVEPHWLGNEDAYVKVVIENVPEEVLCVLYANVPAYTVRDHWIFADAINKIARLQVKLLFHEYGYTARIQRVIHQRFQEFLTNRFFV